VKGISKGIALIIVGGFVASLGGTWPIIVGLVLALAGAGTIIQASKLKL
jgi:hypothetical protein